MNPEDLKYLTDEQKTRYMMLDRLFNQPGWAVVVELAKTRAMEQRDRAAFAKSWDDNRTALGAGFVYNEFSQLQETTDMEFAQLALNAKQAAQEEDETEHE